MLCFLTSHVYWMCDSSSSENMCTVVYFDDCVSIRQCKLYCESMGGSKYRWFHNACCQCIGPECVDYGSKAVKCMNCLFWNADARRYPKCRPHQRTEARGNYDGYELAFLSYLVKYPPFTPPPPAPAKCFYSAVKFHCIFLDMFSIVFFTRGVYE